MAQAMAIIFVPAIQELNMVVPTIARNVIVGGVIQIGPHVNLRKPRREYNTMAKQAKNVRLEIAAELLKLEARLNEGIDARLSLRCDQLALDAIKAARNHWLPV